MRVYLAGPDVFVAEPATRAAALKAVCARHGLEGVSPLDPRQQPPEWDGLPEFRRIALCNEAHIVDCRAVIANLTPFRGPSADPGTVFEVGFARALGRPVFGWTADPRPFTERTRAFLGAPDGMLVEAFGCTDNLMIDAAAWASGAALVVRSGEADDLAVFERCVALAARALAG
jgi:nucleoside 2-deoxyribosyltransferase